MLPMLSKACASWLVLLVLLPFTPAFSTPMIVEILPGTPNDCAERRSSIPTAALTHGALLGAVALPNRLGRLRPAMTRLHGSAVVPNRPVAAAAGLSNGLTIHVLHRHSRPIVLRI
jgi:hypothetical protein